MLCKKINLIPIILLIISICSLYLNTNQVQAKKSKDCIVLSEGECARHKDGSPQECEINNKDGICSEAEGKCKCVSAPRSCDEYEKLFADFSCYDCDGSRLSCPIGNIVTISYGTLVGEIYCCCNNNDVRKVNGGEEGTNVIQSNDEKVVSP